MSSLSSVISSNTAVTPGQLLFAGDQFLAGKGTYSLSSSSSSQQIFSSLIGRVVVDGNTVQVVGSRAEVLPQVGAVVVGRVMRVTPKLADVQILLVQDTPVLGGNGFRGTLRKENVRSFQSDQVDMFASFRQGDLIKAAVAALGGARSYELSTARDELGVIHALSGQTDEPLVPISWTAMQVGSFSRCYY